MIRIIIIFDVFIFFSCQNNHSSEVKEYTQYYRDGRLWKKYNMLNGKLHGNYSVYYLNGNIKAKHIYIHGVKKDSFVYYYDDLVNTVHQIDYHSGSDTIVAKDYYPGSAIRSTGKIYKQNKIGKWKYYKKDGSLEKVFEYMTINGEQYTNQGWRFDSAGDTLKTARMLL